MQLGKIPQNVLRLVKKKRFFFKVSIVCSTTEQRGENMMGLVTSFQASTRIASFIVLPGSAFPAFSILLKERLFNSKKSYHIY